MSQDFPYLAIGVGLAEEVFDGAVFQDGAGGETHYPPLRGMWAPQISTWRRYQLAGDGPYSDVTETITFDVVDSSVADVLADIAVLGGLMEQAERFWYGEDVAPVRVYYVVQGSGRDDALTVPLVALIKGRPDSGSALELSGDFADVGLFTQALNNKLRFVRRGPWIGEVVTQTSGEVEIGEFNGTTFPAAERIPSPLRLRIPFSARPAVLPASFFVVAGATDRIQIIEAADFAYTPSKYSSVDDSAYLAQGGDILRYTPTTVFASQTHDPISVPAIRAVASRVAVLASCRNNSLTADYTVWCSFYGDGTLYGVQSTAGLTVSAGASAPAWYLLGEANLADLASPTGCDMYLIVQASEVDATLDIDTIVLVGIDDETSRIIATQATSLSGFSDNEITVQIGYDPRSNRAPAVKVVGSDNGDEISISHAGNPALVSKEASLYVLWLATGPTLDGTTPVNFWRMAVATEGDPVVFEYQLSADRYSAYLTPE